jgi:uncharacterized RDD family membrane protein YckC
MPPATTEPQDWPGKRLGLPETGPRSIARLGRRLIALIIDWGIATALVWAFVHKQDGGWILAVFAVLQVLFIALLSGSIGHLIAGLRVVPLNPGWIGFLKPAIRTVLLCVVIPAVIWDVDQRGLHDRLAGTALVRRAPAIRR